MLINEPWLYEPNHKEWNTKVGYKAVIKRHKQLQHLCGYVCVNKDHMLYGINYDDARHIDIHGGLTYSQVNPDSDWVFGFDCAGFNDYVPGMGLELTPIRGRGKMEYRTIEFVEAECENLAHQLYHYHTIALLI